MLSLWQRQENELHYLSWIPLPSPKKITFFLQHSSSLLSRIHSAPAVYDVEDYW